MNGLVTTAINFALMLGYARRLGPESLGRLVASQAQVLVWIALVDLGMTAGLMSALTHTNPNRRGRLVSSVLKYRLFGAGIALVVITSLSGLSCRGYSCFAQDLAFFPYLVGYALQYTLASTLVFYGRLPLSVAGNLLGVFIANSIAVVLLFHGASIASLLFVQSLSGFIAFAVMRLFRGNLSEIDSFESGHGIENASFSIREVFRDIWPSTLVLAVMSVAARLDQIAIAHASGFEQGGQYALAVRLVAIPVLFATSIQFALFSDMQRVGRDDPAKLVFFTQVAVKWFIRFGPIVAAAFLGLSGWAIAPFLPKFKPAVALLPFFLPGVVAFFVYNALSATLFGLRSYRTIAKVHLFSLIIYAAVIGGAVLVRSQTGIVLAYNLFYILLSTTGLRAFRTEVRKRELPLSSVLRLNEAEASWLKSTYRKAFDRFFHFASR